MGNPIRVLIVDDDPVDRELTRRLLAGHSRMQFEVDTADQLRRAQRALRSRIYDVLLLDLNLPGSVGLSTLDAIRRENGDFPIIVLSGVNDEDTALRSLDHGAQDYLVKGNVTTDSLANSIRYSIQRHQLRHELTDAKELLERKNRKLAELYQTAHRFVDHVSHEFRTPLTVIKEYTSLVRDGFVESAEETRRFLDIVADRADALNSMVDDMLDVSKLEAGLLGAWRRPQSLLSIIDSLRPTLERKASVKDVALSFDIPSDLPHIYGDGEKIGRVLINLTVNAIKFCHDNGQVRIWARECSDTPGVVVGVTDNGPGIDEENLKRIFERFQQVNGHIHDGCKGFGLGLNIAKELVDLNFGEMNVESRLGEGSTFTFTLPPADPEEVMRRYLRRLAYLRNGSSKVTLLTAHTDESIEKGAAEDIDAFLHSLLRRNDVVFRVSTSSWAIVLAANEIEFEHFLKKVNNTLADINRNRIHGPLPAFDFRRLATLPVTGPFQDVYARLRPLLEPNHAEVPYV